MYRTTERVKKELYIWCLKPLNELNTEMYIWCIKSILKSFMVIIMNYMNYTK